MPISRVSNRSRTSDHILAEDLDDAIAIAKGNPEFEYGTTARIEVRPIKMKEETTSYIYPTVENISK